MQLLGLSAAIGLTGCLGDEDEGEGAVDGNGEAGEDSTGTGQQSEDDGGIVGTDSEDGSTESAGSSGNPRLRDVFNWDSSYVMEMDTPEGSGRTVTHESDMYAIWSHGGEELETYRLSTGTGFETYTVVAGQCFKTSHDVPADDLFEPGEPAEDDEEYVAVGTTTIGGEQVYEFDVEDGSYYLSVDTGYPVRWEGIDGTVVDMHSWGNTDPISPPEMECMEQ